MFVQHDTYINKNRYIADIYTTIYHNIIYMCICTYIWLFEIFWRNNLLQLIIWKAHNLFLYNIYISCQHWEWQSRQNINVIKFVTKTHSNRCWLYRNVEEVVEINISIHLFEQTKPNLNELLNPLIFLILFNRVIVIFHFGAQIFIQRMPLLKIRNKLADY